MDISILAKDFKESWSSFSNQIEYLKEKGLEVIQEFSGDTFGIDSDFILLSNKPISRDVAEELVREIGVEDKLDDNYKVNGELINYILPVQKELHIWLTENYPTNMSILVTFDSTNKALKENKERVNTTQPHFCSTQWLVKGYKLFVHMLDGEKVEITLGGNNKYTQKEIRVGHNLERLLLANVFGKATKN